MLIQVIGVQILAFVGLALLLRWMFTRNVTSAMHRMELLHQENIKKEADLRHRLTAAEAEYRAKIEQADTEAKAMIAAARGQADQTREEVLREARRESERIIQEAQEKRQDIRMELEQEMEQRAVQLASDAVRYVLTTKVEERIHEQLVDELLAEMVLLDSGRLEIKAGQAEVVASQELKPDQRKRLESILAEKAGRPVRIREEVDQKIIAGMVIRLDNLILDGSLRNKLREAVSYVRRSSA